MLFILSRPPHDPLLGPVLDMIFSAAAFGLAPSLIFCGQGKSLLGRQNQQAATNALALENLVEFGLGACYVVTENDETGMIGNEDLCLPCCAISDTALQQLIAAADCVQSF